LFKQNILKTVAVNAIQYELLVKRLLAARLYHDTGESPTIQHRHRYTGASGQQHEIDLSFETILAGTRLLVLIECKCYSHRVGVDDVAELAYKTRDIGAHKAILVSTVGFQKGAILVARREGIGLGSLSSHVRRMLTLVRQRPRKPPPPEASENPKYGCFSNGYCHL
jgi:restriction endonuclease